MAALKHSRPPHCGQLSEASRLVLRRKSATHTQGHSVARHLLESGYDIHAVQERLGHWDVSTRLIYTYVLNRGEWLRRWIQSGGLSQSILRLLLPVNMLENLTYFQIDPACIGVNAPFCALWLEHHVSFSNISTRESKSRPACCRQSLWPG